MYNISCASPVIFMYKCIICFESIYDRYALNGLSSRQVPYLNITIFFNICLYLSIYLDILLIFDFTETVFNFLKNYWNLIVMEFHFSKNCRDPVFGAGKANGKWQWSVRRSGF